MLTAGRGAGPLPEQGEKAEISFAAEAALALPQGKLASE